ncbi:tautomerase family protein [Desulfovibrio sp. X2]|uniref:tautomerase family protein n=1 Tax=Desulfovibrio sp. X2 TaxID=941449 RepID=UPI000A005734
MAFEESQDAKGGRGGLTGRTVELKQKIYTALADGLEKALGIPRADVMVNLVEVVKENCSFGEGVAQYA